MHLRFSYKEGLLPICDFLQIDELGQSMALQSHVKLLNSIACQVIVKSLNFSLEGKNIFDFENYVRPHFVYSLLLIFSTTTTAHFSIAKCPSIVRGTCTERFKAIARLRRVKFQS